MKIVASLALVLAGILAFAQDMSVPLPFEDLKNPEALMTDDYLIVVGTVAKATHTQGLIAINKNTHQQQSIKMQLFDPHFVGTYEKDGVINIYLTVIKPANSDPIVACVQLSKETGTLSDPRDVTGIMTSMKDPIVAKEGLIVVGNSVSDRSIIITTDSGKPEVKKIKVDDKTSGESLIHISPTSPDGITWIKSCSSSQTW